MENRPSEYQNLAACRELLELGYYSRSEECFRACASSVERDFGLVEAILANPTAPRLLEALHILVARFYTPAPIDVPDQRSRLLGLLHRVSSIADPELANLMARGAQTLNPGPHSLLKAFYFGGALTEETLGERTVRAQIGLQRRMRRGRTISNEDYTIEFAKLFSSCTHLGDLAPENAVGGGYFLNLGGLGCVVDPGYGFLKSFYRLGRTLYDIDCIIVTHFHDDHYAELPALLSLLRQRGGGQPIKALLDQTTYRQFQPIIDSSMLRPGGSGYISDVEVLCANGTSIPLRDGVDLRALPTRHSIFGESTGVGLDFDLRPRRSRLVITGDTGWIESLAEVYRKFRGQNITLVAHVSSARPQQELLPTLSGHEGGFYATHLCIHGLTQVIEAAEPERLILSEIGEELYPVSQALVELIQQAYPSLRQAVHVGNIHLGAAGL